MTGGPLKSGIVWALAAFLLNAWEGAVLRSRVEKSAAPLDAFMSVAFNKILT